MFEVFTKSVEIFNFKYIVVQPLNDVAYQTVCFTGFRDIFEDRVSHFHPCVLSLLEFKTLPKSFEKTIVWWWGLGWGWDRVYGLNHRVFYGFNMTSYIEKKFGKVKTKDWYMTTLYFKDVSKIVVFLCDLAYILTCLSYFTSFFNFLCKQHGPITTTTYT